MSNVLQLFSTFEINLTKIQSLPIIGKPWQYAFFVDVFFKDYTLFNEVTKVLEKAVEELKIIGVYKQNFDNSFKDYTLWIAHYHVRKPNNKQWNFWQHSDRGKVSGINTPVDFNVFNRSLEEMNLNVFIVYKRNIFF